MLAVILIVQGVGGVVLGPSAIDISASEKSSSGAWSAASEITSAPQPPRPGSANSYLNPVLVPDAQGGLHLLSAKGFGLTRMEEPEPEPIHHWALSESGWRAEAGIPTMGRIVSSITARSGKDGRLYVLWGDDGTVATSAEKHLNLTSLAGGVWSESQVISDKPANPATFWGNADLVVRSVDNAHVFWTDYRESHPFLSLFDAGDFQKTFHRILRDGAWIKPGKVQRRGHFDASNPRAVEDPEGRLHLFWEQTEYPVDQHGKFEVLHSILENDKWSKPEQITAESVPDGSYCPIQDLAAARGHEGSFHVAWIRMVYSKQPQVEALLTYRSFTNGSWSTSSTVISRRCRQFVWVRNRDEVLGVVFQEYAPESKDLDEHRGFGLYYARMSASGPGSKELIEDDVAEGLFDAAVDSVGTQHVVFVRPAPGSRMHLMHRSLRHEATQLQHPFQGRDR